MTTQELVDALKAIIKADTPYYDRFQAVVSGEEIPMNVYDTELAEQDGMVRGCLDAYHAIVNVLEGNMDIANVGSGAKWLFSKVERWEVSDGKQ